MIRSFLLRFQESCCESLSSEASVGTKTKTAVAQEGPDNDPWSKSTRVIPSHEPSLGTKTGTRVGKEVADADHASGSRTLPVQLSAGTMTATAVKMETGDQDRRQQHLMMLPRCS